MQLTILQNQWEPWACFPATRWSHPGIKGDGDGRFCAPMRISCHPWPDRRGSLGSNVSDGKQLWIQTKLHSLAAAHLLLCTLVPKSPWINWYRSMPRGVGTASVGDIFHIGFYKSKFSKVFSIYFLIVPLFITSMSYIIKRPKKMFLMVSHFDDSDRLSKTVSSYRGQL